MTELCSEVIDLVRSIFPDRDVRSEEPSETKSPDVIFVYPLAARLIRIKCSNDGPGLRLNVAPTSTVPYMERVIREALNPDTPCSICWEACDGGSICIHCGARMCSECCVQYNKSAKPYECHHCQAWIEPDMMQPIVDRLKARKAERLRTEEPGTVVMASA